MSKSLSKSRAEAKALAPSPTGQRDCTLVKIPLPRAPIPMLRRLMQIAYAISAELWEDEDCTVIEFSVLLMVSRENSLDQIGLAERIGIDRTNIGVTLDRMEREGWIERQVNPSDRRARLVQLTKTGRDKLARIAPTTAIVREKLFAPLTVAEREIFYDLMERMIAANEHYSRPGAGRRKRRRG